MLKIIKINGQSAAKTLSENKSMVQRPVQCTYTQVSGNIRDPKKDCDMV